MHDPVPVSVSVSVPDKRLRVKKLRVKGEESNP
jgi:hypothetical protein